MPKGRVKINATSPKHPDWPRDPEKAVAAIVGDHNATYVPRSLHFSHDRKWAWAVIDTVEPEEGSQATRFFDLAQELDAVEITLLIGSERWLELGGTGEQS